MNVQKFQKEKNRFLGNNKVDTKEFELPDTIFIRDIDPKVFQSIVLQCMSEIDGVALAEGSFISSILGKKGPEVASSSDQDNRTHSVSIKIEVNIRYGIPIPEKAEEIQTKIVEEIIKLTGLHVSAVHIVFKNVLPLDQMQMMLNRLNTMSKQAALGEKLPEEEYGDDF